MERFEELREILGAPETLTLLYHALYGREAVLGSDAARRYLPALQAVVRSSDAEFRGFVTAVLSALSEMPPGTPGVDEAALLLRSMLAWRMHGELPDDESPAFRSWAHLNEQYFEGEMPPPAAFRPNTQEEVAELVDAHREEWEELRGEADLAAAVNAVSGSFQLPTKLWHYCEMRDMHDVFTEEYISLLALALSSSGDPSPILEVGCGRGDLSRLLSKALGIPIIPTDADPFPGVECLPYQQALEKHCPATVLCAWMPFGCDWTPAFRRCRSVRRYVVIGPPSVSATPSAWSLPEDATRDGWQATHLEALDKHLICKLDSPEDPWNSRTLLVQKGE